MKTKALKKGTKILSTLGMPNKETLPLGSDLTEWTVTSNGGKSGSITLEYKYKHGIGESEKALHTMLKSEFEELYV